MRYPILLVADTHLTSNTRDEYRWGLFPWLRENIKEHSIKSLCFLGDLSDAKDFHPSSLVNRMAREFSLLMEFPWLRCFMIPGNHEWLKQGEEFWRFLNYTSDRLRYFTHPSDDPEPHNDGPLTLFLPFSKTPRADWDKLDFDHYQLALMHQTVGGSRASNGDELDGEDVPVDKLKRVARVYSGDIHVPQRVGCVEYVGSPYHVHFGDAFRPRCVLLTGPRDQRDLRFRTLSRVTIDATDLEAVHQHIEDLRKGDQVKLRMHLQQSEMHEWKTLRRRALGALKDAHVEVHGLELIVDKSARRRLGDTVASQGSKRSTPSDDVVRFVMSEDLGADALDAALEVIES